MSAREYQARRTPARRRRSQEEAEQEILDGAEEFLQEHSWYDLTVDEVMARTSLSRQAFYHYFDDRKQLLVQLMQRVGDELADMTDHWLTGGGPSYDGALAALTDSASVYARHGRLIRAVTEAGSQDPDVRELRERIFRRFVNATAKSIREQMRAGEIDGGGPSAAQLAEALVSLNDAYLTRCFGWGQPHPDPADAARTLLQVWSGALYLLTPQQIQDRG